jgi:excisionase family DNA binding protein
MEHEAWLTLKEAAERLRVSTRTLLTWLRRGDLHGHKVGRDWRIKWSAVEAFLTVDQPGSTLAPAEEGL